MVQAQCQEGFVVKDGICVKKPGFGVKGALAAGLAVGAGAYGGAKLYQNRQQNKSEPQRPSETASVKAGSAVGKIVRSAKEKADITAQIQRPFDKAKAPVAEALATGIHAVDQAKRRVNEVVDKGRQTINTVKPHVDRAVSKAAPVIKKQAGAVHKQLGKTYQNVRGRVKKATGFSEYPGQTPVTANCPEGYVVKDGQCKKRTSKLAVAALGALAGTAIAAGGHAAYKKFGKPNEEGGQK